MSQSEFILPPIQKLYNARFYKNSFQSSMLQLSNLFIPLGKKQTHYNHLLQNNLLLARKVLSRKVIYNSSKSLENLSLIDDFNYSTRNFGLIIDNEFEEKSRFHRGQKFGPRHARKILPHIKHKTEANDFFQMTLAKPKKNKLIQVYEKKDDRQFFKRVLMLKGVGGVILLFKSLEVHLVQELEAKSRRRQRVVPLRMVFTNLLQLMCLPHDELIDVLSARTELIEKNRLKIDLEDYNFGMGLTEDWEFPIDEEMQADIGASQPRRYKVVYPTIEIYVPEHSYTQVIQLKLSEVIKLIHDGFDSLPEYTQQFNVKNFRKHVKQQKEVLKRLQEQGGKDQEDEGSPKLEEIGDSPQQSREIPAEAPGFCKDDRIVDSDARSEVSDSQKGMDIQVKKSDKEVDSAFFELKRVKSEDGKRTITFMYAGPISVSVKTKKKGKTVKNFVCSIKEFYGIVYWSETKDVQELFEKHLVVSFEGMSEDLWQLDDFKKYCQIDFQIPFIRASMNVDLEKVGEVNIENGLFEEHQRSITVNNKELLITMSPAIFEIETVGKSKLKLKQKEKTQQKILSQSLNDILKRKFNCEFKVI